MFRKCQVKVITEIRKNESGDRIKVERTVKVIHTLFLLFCNLIKGGLIVG